MLIVLTSKNKVLIIQNDTLVHSIVLAEKEELFSIVATRKGFCTGGSGKNLSIYELDKAFTPNLLLGSAPKPCEHGG